MERNKIELVGKVLNDYQFSHSCYDERYYSTALEVKRKTSETTDLVPLMIPEMMTYFYNDIVGKQVKITGNIRTHNTDRHLIVNVFVEEIIYLNEDDVCDNSLFLEGHICKHPVHRTTPKGKLITEFHLAVNRNYGKSDYIPCIAWGKLATEIKDMVIGDNLQIEGRFQSRTYTKDDKVHTTYEISTTNYNAI